ncbi:hypothetical protein JST97_32850 [bacterium]|nr:hypothetical protein [bacterium]
MSSGPTFSFSPKSVLHEGELASTPGLRADLSRQRLISYLETTPPSNFDTGGVGRDLLPFYCSQPLQLQIATSAPHLASARILDRNGKVMASWQNGHQEISLPVGDYQLELTSNLQADTHIFFYPPKPAAIRPLTLELSTPGVYISQLTETPQPTGVVGPQTLLVGASRDGSSQAGLCYKESDLQIQVPMAGANLSQSVHQYFANGGTQVMVASSSSSAAADLSTALNQLPGPLSYQLVLVDFYQLPLDQADQQAAAALAWVTQRNGLLFLDIPGSVASSAEAITWREQRPQLDSSRCLLYWPGLDLGNGQAVGASASVLGLLDQLQSKSGPGAPALGQKLQGAQSPEVIYPLKEVVQLGFAQINPVYPDLSVVAGVLLAPQPGIPDLSSQQKLLAITQTIQLTMQDYVFSPNAPNTWQILVQAVSATMLALYQQGVLAGSTPDSSFQFACGIPTTMTTLDILNGYMILSGSVLLEPLIPPVALKFTQVMQSP